MLEASLQRYCQRTASLAGWLTFKLEAKSRRGFPDLMLVSPTGKILLVELKVPGGRLSKLQARTIEKLRSRGVRVYVIDNKEDFNELIEFHA
jgi:hypothetical protein